MSTEAAAGEWIVSLESTPPSRNVDGEMEFHDAPTSRAKTPNAALGRALEGLRELGIEFGRYLGDESVFLLRSPTTMAGSVLSSLLSAVPGFVSVDPNSVARAAFTPNDPHYSKQWGLHNTGQSPFNGTNDADIDAPEVWDLVKGSPSVVVAVLDTGMNYNHEDLYDNRWVNPNEIGGDGIDNDGNGIIDDNFGYDFHNDDTNPMDDESHGTKVAGVIGAVGDNNKGIAGIAQTVKLLPVKVLDNAGGAFLSNITDGLIYVRELYDVGVNVRVINASIRFHTYIPAMQTQISNLEARGIMVVAASGNDLSNNDSTPVYPANFAGANVISVAASTPTDILEPTFSNYGSTTVDLVAPGDDIYTTTSFATNNGYGYVDGTSFAAPMVSGTLALLLAVKPDLTVAEMRSLILDNVDVKGALSGKVATSGRLNANKAMDDLYTNYGIASKTFLGDIGGARKNDDFRIRPKPGDSTITEIQVYQGGSYVTVATTNNATSKTIAIYTLSGFTTGVADKVIVESGVNNRLTLTGGNGADSLQGGDSNDSIWGASGNDTIQGGGGNDLLKGGGNNDYIRGDNLYGTAGDDTIEGGSGDDTLFGDGGNDYIIGGSGTDSFRGGSGNDWLYAIDGYIDYGEGESGSDTIDQDPFDFLIS